MTARRLLALLTLLLTFHLSVAGADEACADHGRSSMSGDHGMQGDHDMTSGAIPHDDSGNPCPTPSGTHCCEAVTSCAPAFAVAPREAASLTTLERVTIPAGSAELPRARSLGPEPPPPKIEA